MFYTGCVENRFDPLEIGRCQVRILGLHSEDKMELPTEDLPWAFPLTPITSASISGIGNAPVGPVEGTWVIVFFRDEDQQQPIMFGTLGGIPQSKAAELASQDSNGSIIATESGILLSPTYEELKTSLGIPIAVGTKESFNNTVSTVPETAPEPKLTEQKVPNVASSSALDKPIPTAPEGSSAKQQQGIQALISACDKVGLTSKYAKCAILGICGEESAWLPVEEGCSYSAERLLQIFPSAFRGQEDKAQYYARWKGTKAEFFDFVYRPSASNGKGVGNKIEGDGGKYYGRGFNQITGRAGYTDAQSSLKSYNISVDLLTNPEKLISDIDVAALACVLYYKKRVKKSHDDPTYFESALVATGHDAGGVSYSRKRAYYEYFLGEKTSVAPTSKPMAGVNKRYSESDVAGYPTSKRVALLEDRSANSVVGFSDPNGKYPLRNLLDEADTNRLARGIQKETAIEFKDSTRVRGIQSANGGGAWEQPLAPFGGRYPFSKVMETESGHLMIFDDTPTNETISLYHRTGSFIDIDANGTQVNRIIGDGYTIIDHNGSVYIGGDARVTVGNGVNIYVQGMADVQVDGYATINLNNNADIGVGGDLNISVGGDMNVTTGGSCNINAGTSLNTNSTNDTNMKSGGKYNISTKSDYNLATEASANIKSSSHFGVNSDGFNIFSKNANLDFASALNVNYSTADFGNGSASTPEMNIPSFTVPVSSFSAPTFTSGNHNSSEFIPTPVRPAPPVNTKKDITDSNNALVDDYNKNPSAYYNADASSSGVKSTVQPKDDGQGNTLISGATPGDIKTFLDKQLELASSGYWRETGQGGAESNPNILRIWTDLGLSFKSDQIAWCAGFVQWTLQQCGYRYVQNARAFAIHENPALWKATKVSLSEAQTGDIVVWNYSHVNFFYGDGTFVGGNQSPKNKGNNPNDGDLTMNHPNVSNILAIYRPSKV